MFKSQEVQAGPPLNPLTFSMAAAAVAKYQRAIGDAEGSIQRLRASLAETAEKATMDAVTLPSLEGE